MAVVMYGEVIRGVSARVQSILLKKVTLLTTRPRMYCTKLPIYVTDGEGGEAHNAPPSLPTY